MPRLLLRVVLDTSVYISAAISPRGKSGRVWELAQHRQFQLLTSPFIVNETGRVMRRLRRETPQAIAQRLRRIVHLAEIIQPVTTLNVVRDANDNPIVECAVDGLADMIVSLDNDLLVLKEYNNIPILHLVDVLRTFGK